MVPYLVFLLFIIIIIINHKEIEKEEGGESGSGLGILTSAVAFTWNERLISILILQPSKER